MLLYQLGSAQIDIIEFDGDIGFNGDPTQSDCDGSIGVFGIENGAIVIRDVEGSSCCECAVGGGPQECGNNLTIGLSDPYIFTQALCNVTIEVEAIASGPLETCSGSIGLCDPQNFPGGDQMVMQLVIDGNANEIGGFCGSDKVGTHSFSLDEVDIGTSLILNLAGGTQDDDEEYRIERIVINGTPKSALSAQFINPVTELCEGEDVLILNALPSDGIDYNWVGPNGVINEDSPNLVIPSLVTPSDAGEYSVTVTETGGCTSTTSVTIDVITCEMDDFRFSFLERPFCESEIIVLPTLTDDGRSGTWNITDDPLDLMNRNDSLELIFTIDGNSNIKDTVYLRIDTIPNPGNNITNLDICVNGNDPIIDLVEIFDLNPENISRANAFGMGYDTEEELRNVNTEGFSIGPYTISFNTVQNGACTEQLITTNIELDRVFLPRDTIVELCEGDPNLINFEDLISVDAGTGNWADLSGSGVDLFFPDAVVVDQLDPGTYQYQITVDGLGICSDSMSTAVLELEILPEVFLGVSITELSLCGTSDSVFLDFVFSETGMGYEIEVQLFSDLGIENLGTTTVEEESYFLIIKTTDQGNRLEAGILFLNPDQSPSYEIEILSFNGLGGNICPAPDIDGSGFITFQEPELVTIDTTLCQGEVFKFMGNSFSTPVSNVLIESGIACDTSFLLNLSFTSASVVDILLDPCVMDPDFRGIPVRGDTTIRIAGVNGRCDSVFNIDYNPSRLQDSLYQDELCFDASVEIMGVTFDRDNPTGSFDIITDLGCTQTVLVLIDFELRVTSDLDTLVCEGTSLVIDGITFDEDNPDGEVVYPEGSINGCDSVLNVSLTFIEAEPINVPVTLCPEQTKTLFGITVDENTASTDQFSIGPNLCDSVITFSVTVAEDIVIDFDTTVCEGEMVMLFGEFFSMDNPASTINLQTGNGCDSTINVSVNFNNSITADLNQSLCTGQSIVVNGTTYDEANPMGQEIFTSALGCDSIVNVSVNFTNAITTDLNQSLCTGQSIVVNDTKYDEVNPMGQEIFTSAQGCDSIVNIDLSFGSLNAVLDAVDACPGEEFGGVVISELNGTGPYTVEIGGELSIVDQSSVFIDELSRGDYDVLITDDTGCDFNGTVVIGTAAALDLTINSSDLGDGTSQLDLAGMLPIDSVVWSPQTGLSCTDCLDPIVSVSSDQTYMVTAYDDNGCSETLTFTITVGAEQEAGFYLPNSFDPQSAINNRFFLQSEIGLIARYDMQIFSRWGEKVYETINAIPNDRNFGWDGTNQGLHLNPDVYMYRILMTTNRGTEILETGDILLVH